MAKYVGLDVGSKTLGIAVSEGYFANPHSTIKFEENDFVSAAQKLNEFLQNEKYEKIIVGLPKNMDGSVGHRVEMVEDFLNECYVQKIFEEKDITFVDERLTTRMATSIMVGADLSRKKQKQNKDQLAAKLILETFLQQIK